MTLRFGRKIVFFTLAAMIGISEVAATLVNNLAVLAFIRLLNGTALPAMFILPYVLSTYSFKYGN